MYTLLRSIPGIEGFLKPGEVYPGQPRLAAIYKVLEDGEPHELTVMLDELPIKNLPEKLRIDMTRLKSLLKRHTDKGRKHGLWECTVRDGIAQMTTLPAGE